MLEKQSQNSDIFIQRLRERAAIAKVRIEQSEKNLKEKEDIENAIKTLNEYIRNTKDAIALITKNMKLIDSFTIDKKAKSLKGIYQSIDIASNIVDASKKISLVHGKSESYMQTADGWDVDLTEASSWRAMTSVGVRKAVLVNTTYISDLILDEHLSVLDDTSSADFSLQVPLLAQDCMIIFIEQKNSVFSNADPYTYWFENIAGETSIRRLDV